MWVKSGGVWIEQDRSSAGVMVKEDGVWKLTFIGVEVSAVFVKQFGGWATGRLTPA